ncbi:ATP-binding protein [Profundibacter amoris]|uniref:histidine kinase n=1 Tax=Profundibacter amoris TaxID=2171755 RepID=A0A347UIC7_9RHOB|nr:ATP-binding protein [Profundibacter amoris]AXX98605.1 hypothetical protein BAR1_12130 [Profundibacter amoris]
MHSLRQRAIIGGAIWAAVNLLIGFIVLLSIIDDFADRNFKQTLVDRHNQIVVALSNSGGDPDLMVQFASDPVYMKPYSGVYWQVSNVDGFIYGSKSTFDFQFDIPDRSVPELQYWKKNITGGPISGVRKTIYLEDGSEWLVQVAETLQNVNADKLQLRKNLVAAFVIMGFLGIIGAILQTYASLQPLSHLAADVAKRKENRTALNAKDYPKEVAPLVSELNELLKYNHDIVERGRRRAADLAHALKTPSAIIRNEFLTYSTKGIDTGAAEEALNRIDAQTSRSLAQLRADNSKAKIPVPISLRKSVDRISRFLMNVPGNENISVSIDVAEDLIILADQQDIDEIIGNLFENALKWCNETVSISAEQNGNDIVVMIEDDGPGIPKESAKTVLIAGERLDIGKPGYGLGLSISSDLLHSYGQELILGKSEKLGGLIVRFALLNGNT